MRVWIDRDRCTFDGLCTDHLPDVFVMLDDGISYVRVDEHVQKRPGGAAGVVVERPIDGHLMVEKVVMPG